MIRSKGLSFRNLHNIRLLNLNRFFFSVFCLALDVTRTLTSQILSPDPYLAKNLFTKNSSPDSIAVSAGS